MTAQSIISQDLSLSEVFQSFYRVPDYQREYVWGERDAAGERGDEVEQFLRDIHDEYEHATAADAPEYFIGTIVVCMAPDGVFDLIDGQQRTTTAFLVLCAIRDVLSELDEDVPSTLKGQIADGSTDWQGETLHRMRLDLQYEDASGVLNDYGKGAERDPDRQETRSIRNLANAYSAAREFLNVSLGGEAKELRRFHGYFTNKVKLIRIQTPSISRALKIFETINDRGVGLDAMDLLKNLLFMSASSGEFSKLKDIWKELTQQIYDAGEKPLRFLRYFLLATYDVDAKLREEEIYDWLGRNEKQTQHRTDPVAFAKRLRDGAATYRQFVQGRNGKGGREDGIVNTRSLGGSAIKQHFVLLLAGRHLHPVLFRRLCDRMEEMMFVWLIAGTASKDYERVIAQGARSLRVVKTEVEFAKFEADFFTVEKKRRKSEFKDALIDLTSWSLRKFRMKYLLAKLTQWVDIAAYGEQGRISLSSYLDTLNDVEHILASNADQAARKEFGKGADDEEMIESLGNLMWLERSINRSIGNVAYSEKAKAYATSQFLLARCQAAPIKVGSNDQITRTVKTLDCAPVWNADAIERRQAWMAELALDVWRLRPAAGQGQ